MVRDAYLGCLARDLVEVISLFPWFALLVGVLMVFTNRVVKCLVR